MRGYKEIVAAIAAAALATAFAAGTATAHGDSTCSGLGGIEVHGQHVIGDYVTGLGGIGGGLEWPPAGQVGAAIQANGGGAAVPGGQGVPLGKRPVQRVCKRATRPSDREAMHDELVFCCGAVQLIAIRLEV